MYEHIHKAIITTHNTIMMHKHRSVAITNYNKYTIVTIQVYISRRI